MAQQIQALTEQVALLNATRSVNSSARSVGVTTNGQDNTNEQDNTDEQDTVGVWENVPNRFNNNE